MRQMQDSRQQQEIQTKYKIQSIIGQGSYGRVYRIINQQTRQLFALKKININPFQVQQVLQQLNIMKEFDHPNILHVHESFYDDLENKMQIIMEYCQEGDLLQYFINNKKKLTERDILEKGRQIINVFVMMNINGIFHRDVKPENIMLKGGVIKIGDFGCAKKLLKEGISKIDNYTQERGTPIYSSPQLILNLPYSAKCDVWSFGTIIYFLYFGQHPFLDQTTQKCIKKINQLTKDVKQLNLQSVTKNRAISKSINRVLNLTLQYQEKDRATWRQLSLSGVFEVPKMDNIGAYLQYLRNISIVSNWLAKHYWQIRKQIKIGDLNSQKFVYYLIRYQYSVVKMAKQLLTKESTVYDYLLDQQAYSSYKPTEKLVEEIFQIYQNNKNYYEVVLQSFKKNRVDLMKQINQKDSSQKHDCFCDLDQSIKYSFKILQKVVDKINTQQYNNNHKQNTQVYRVWIVMARWINFQQHYHFRFYPRIQKILAQDFKDYHIVVKSQIQKYKTRIF